MNSMIPRTFRRYSSNNATQSTARKLIASAQQPLQSPLDELVRRKPANLKMHARGFTRPATLRAADWFPGGAYQVPSGMSIRAYSTDGSSPPDSTSYKSSPKETASVRKRVLEEFLLRRVTKKNIAQRRPEGKVPYEDLAADGRILHPSGFVVPEPGEAPESYADHRERSKELDRGIPESVQTFSDLSEMATAEISTRSEKVPQEFQAEDGTVEHVSGFMPPSPQQASMSGVKELYKPALKLTPDETSPAEADKSSGGT